MQRIGGLILSQHATDAEVEELLGGSIEAGLFYFNTVKQCWRTYTGDTWVNLPMPARAVDTTTTEVDRLRAHVNSEVSGLRTSLQTLTNSVDSLRRVSESTLTRLNKHLGETASKFTSLVSADEVLETTAKKIGKSLLTNTTTEIVDGVGVDETFELGHTAEGVVSIEAYDGTTGALIKMLNIADTDYEHVSGDKVVTCKTDQSANILRVVYTRNSW